MIWQNICVFSFLSVVSGKFHLYNTEVSNNHDYKDCLYSFKLISDINEWQLIPYCIRHHEYNSSDTDERCDDGATYTFEQLKSKGINSYHLYEWNAPIDIINEYQKYLTNDDLTLASYLYCTCSGNWFGTRCQYSFSDTEQEYEINEIVERNFGRKSFILDEYELAKNSAFLTCYEGLRCHSTICLDWQEICNGIFNCENGEDEPVECLLLETNECKDHEYRCRFGMCIPKIFLRDFSYDCMDLSDEKPNYVLFRELDDSCYESSKLECDYRLCDVDKFACGDGQCLFARDWDQQCGYLEDCDKHCHNARDLFFSQNLLRFNLSRNDNNLTNISFECWFLLVCTSVERESTLFGYNYKTCPCSKSTVSKSQYSRYFQNYCPTSFVFQTANNFLYPFVQLLYYNTSNSSFEWWLPTHFCYNSTRCPNLPVKGSPLIDNLLCVAMKEFKHSKNTSSTLMHLFSTCAIAHASILTSDKRLFYCNKSMKFISKNKIYDGWTDCLHREDEDWTSDATMMRIVNLTDRFKCSTTNQWVSRRLIGQGYCSDKSDTLYIGTCTRASDIACQFLRGLYIPPIHYLFQENCDGYRKILLVTQNETDETNCEEWPKYRRCDSYWDLPNGEDELNCSNTIASYITYTVAKCRTNEYYCMFRNGTMGCLSKEFAGNGHADCIGGTDERKQCASIDPRSPFQCYSGQCFSLRIICNEEFDCGYDDDELICPWSYNITNNHLWYIFFCKNGTAIKYTKRCDKVIDCRPDAEDEWFCDLGYQKTVNSSEFIEEYPLLITDSSPLTAEKASQSPASLPLKNNFLDSLYSLDDWYCNRGIIARGKSSRIECFCSPSYYGPRCEYQSERLLITLRVDTQATLSGHENPRNAIRLIACLMFNDLVVHHEDILHVPLMKQMFYLNYPLPPPKQQGNWTVRLDAFLINTFSVNFLAAWKFDVPFPFLPFNRLVLYLTLKEQRVCNTYPCVHGNCRKYLNPPHNDYCQCEQHWSGKYCNISTICSCAGGGKCIDRHRTPICVCPLGRMGKDCYASFNPCNNVQCQHDGTCVPLDERLPTKFTCACRRGYYGPRCELADAYVDIHFTKVVFAYNHLLSTAVVVHFLESKTDSSGILFVQNRLLYKQVQLDKLFRIFNNGYQNLSSFILLQIFLESNHFEYYIAAIVKSKRTHITTTIHQMNRCPHVNELLLNKTFHEFSLMKKIKYYQRVCQVNNIFKYFHDEAYLCFCDKDSLPQCLFFQRESTRCTTNYCQNNGYCVQNNFNGMQDFACVCSGCSYGSLCQLTTSQYVLSLDAMLGRDILTNVSLTEQPLLIKMVLVVLMVMLSLGFISNVLSMIIFKQPIVREVGCGMYLFCLPIVGQCGLLALAGRFFYLLHTQLYNVDNYSTTFWSCVGLEYSLSVFPMLFDWLTACVAIERSISMVKGISFQKSDSVWWAKRTILFLTTIVFGTGWHEPFVRQIIDDPRSTTRHTWCTLMFRWSWLEYYRLIINLINLIIPALINTIATVFLLHKSTRMKQAFGKNKNEKTYFATLKRQLPLYQSPLTLVGLSLMRLIFSFTLVCIIHEWQKYVYLTAYLISFAPLIGTFPIFVLPAEIYKTEFKKIFECIRLALKMRHI